MRAKAQYYIDVRGRVHELRTKLRWWPTWEGDKSDAPVRYAEKLATEICRIKSGKVCDAIFPHRYREPIHSLGVRVRRRGKVIAQWREGKRVK